MVTPGLLIAFEGIDGCGKTTQVARCLSWIEMSNPELRVDVFREPGGTFLGEQVRRLLLESEEMGPYTEMLLYMAARAELYEREIAPLLEQGGVVLLDRSHYSTAAYQGAGLGLGVDHILDLSNRVIGGRDPDRVVLFDMDPEVAFERVSRREMQDGGGGGDRIEARGIEYFQRVAECYRTLAAAEPARFIVVDASKEIEAIAEEVKGALLDVF